MGIFHMSTITTDVTSCARCHEDHPGLTFRPFANPISLPSTAPLTHWAICPGTGEPIVLRIEKSVGQELPEDYWETAQ